MGKIESMPLSKIAAQIIMPRLNIQEYYENEVYKKAIHKLAKEFEVGGFCIFGGTAEQAKMAIAELRFMAEIPLIFSADYEYGLPMRHQEGTAFPHAMAVAHSGKIENAALVGALIAKEAKEIGVHWNFAPVCDINSNPKNPIINIRAYGENAKQVSEFSSSFILGTQKEKVAACAKHFPGHGDTSQDSHLSLPYLSLSKEELYARELIPFQNAQKAEVKSIMIGHLNIQSFDNDGLPATLSHNIISKLLKEEMHFNGIILTDALDMKAITDNYSNEEASKLAFTSGNDILLLPPDPLAAIQVLTTLCEEDKNLKNQLISSAKKLYYLKNWTGILNMHQSPFEKAQTFMENEKVALKIAFDSIIIEDKQKLIPLAEESRIVALAFLQSEKDFPQASMFFHFLSQATENDLDFGYLSDNMSEEQIKDMISNTQDVDLFVFPFFYKSRAYNGGIGVGSTLNSMVQRIAAGRDVINIYLGNPYLANDIIADSEIFTFSDSMASMAATVMKLVGRENAREEEFTTKSN